MFLCLFKCSLWGLSSCDLNSFVLSFPKHVSCLAMTNVKTIYWQAMARQTAFSKQSSHKVYDAPLIPQRLQEDEEYLITKCFPHCVGRFSLIH